MEMQLAEPEVSLMYISLLVFADWLTDWLTQLASGWLVGWLAEESFQPWI